MPLRKFFRAKFFSFNYANIVTSPQFYAELAGFSIPTSRAFFALTVVSWVKLWRRSYSVWQFFLLVVALLLLGEPCMILSSSFWLSVGAVSVLMLWYQIFPLSLLHWRGKKD
ncbi:Rec2, partial [Pasteurella multocida subsp. multocida str. Anand1_goat]